MSAAAEMQAALVAALAGAEGVSEIASGVFDGPPVRAAYPYLTIGDGFTTDWSHKTGRGREHRLTIAIWDEAGRAARLHGLVGAVEAAIEALPANLPHHRIASLMLIRSRVLRPAGGPWTGMVEYRARTLEA
ncbi:DUF3168 domain-containing protein [Sphingomonas sp.]|uniref:DUF3168 domain-containing protein n=1 Tax=Sphingomonas sp. TaxID=28214 RepID=UPI003B3A96FE